LDEKLYTGRIADGNDSDLRYSEVLQKGKNKTLVKILGGSTQDDPCRSKYWEGCDPCNPCGIDTYVYYLDFVLFIMVKCKTCVCFFVFLFLVLGAAVYANKDVCNILQGIF